MKTEENSKKVLVSVELLDEMAALSIRGGVSVTPEKFNLICSNTHCSGANCVPNCASDCRCNLPYPGTHQTDQCHNS